MRLFIKTIYIYICIHPLKILWDAWVTHNVHSLYCSLCFRTSDEYSRMIFKGASMILPTTVDNQDEHFDIVKYSDVGHNYRSCTVSTAGAGIPNSDRQEYQRQQDISRYEDHMT